MKLSEIGEFGFIERIRKAASEGESVRLGIGDDCAALSLPPGELLLTSTDLLIEDVHFRRAWTDLRALGRKAVAVNVSDVAAMGGRPRHLYVGLGVPASITVEDLESFMAGVLEEAKSYGAALVGGDTCRSPGPLFISVTAEGCVPEDEILTRAGAGERDGIYVSGTLGDSALALKTLLSGGTPEPDLARRHHDPKARVALGRALASRRVASAMIDISDGAIADLGHILEASEVGARLERDALPLSRAFRGSLEESPKNIDLALCGGEDYELLFSVPPEKEKLLAGIAEEIGLSLTRIGVLTAAAGGLVVLDDKGRQCSAGKDGFNHFAPAKPRASK